MKLIHCTQGEQDWHLARRGIPTASNFDRILPPVTMKPGKGAESYMHELIGDTLSLYFPERAESFTNRNIEWGRDTEAEARNWFSMETDAEVVQVGFVTTDDGRFGCSPDGLIHQDGEPVAGLELKCPTERVQAAYLLDGAQVPREYLGQVHGGLVVTGLPVWEFLSYCPGLPPLLVHVEPNNYTKRLAEELERFWEKYQTALKTVREFGTGPTLKETLRKAVELPV